MVLSRAQVEGFGADGYLVCRGLFSLEEAAVLSSVCRAQAPRSESEGGKPYFWGIPNDPDSHDIFNAVCFGHRLMAAVSALLQDEVSLYHRKLVMKDKNSFLDQGECSGNAWAWHQVRHCPGAPRVVCTGVGWGALLLALLHQAGSGWRG
jgi:hypothetical protein